MEVQQKQDRLAHYWGFCAVLSTDGSTNCVLRMVMVKKDVKSVVGEVGHRAVGASEDRVSECGTGSAITKSLSVATSRPDNNKPSQAEIIVGPHLSYS